jgi:hypothetical protein
MYKLYCSVTSSLYLNSHIKRLDDCKLKTISQSQLQKENNSDY